MPNKKIDIVMPSILQCLYKTWLNIAKINTDTSIVGADNNINYSIKDSKSFNYEASITEKL